MLKVSKRNKLRIIGLMSGTSHDGVDAALVEIQGQGAGGKGQEIRIDLIKHLHVPYGKALKDDISKAFNSSTEHICSLNFKLGGVFAKAVLSLLRVSCFSPKDIDAVASHGQTIYHIPPSGKQSGSTLQIGEAAVIAERTGILTVSDFRPRDMAAGGHGAPLVPLTDYLLFKKKGKVRAVLNIGGISNVTLVRGKMHDTIAFDIGPGNSLIDEAVKIYSKGKMSFDKDGSIAKSGKADTKLLKQLLAHPYFRKNPPKSTGRETFGAEMVKDIFEQYGTPDAKDIVSTLTYLTAVTIRNGITPFKPDEVIVTGGGIRNMFLMHLIQAMFEDEGIAVRAISDYGIPPQAKEAVSFAILGYRTLMQMHGNLPSATGARHGVILGKITLP